MPFDKGKKKKLIDGTCGHERCFSCTFKNEHCPICLRERELENNKSLLIEGEQQHLQTSSFGKNYNRKFCLIIINLKIFLANNLSLNQLNQLNEKQQENIYLYLICLLNRSFLIK